MPAAAPFVPDNLAAAFSHHGSRVEARPPQTRYEAQ